MERGINFILTLVTLIGVCSATVTIIFVGICRWLKWAPVNITVNVYHPQQSYRDPTP